MTQNLRTWRVFAGGLATGFLGVMVVAGGKASADPVLPPQPIPTPGTAQGAAPPVRQVTVLPGGVNNRFTPAPAPAPIASPFAPTTVSGPAAAASMPRAATPALTGTIRDYLQEHEVKLEAQRPQGFKALQIALPMPPRWTPVPDPNVPDAFAVIADRLGNSIYTSNAQVVVYKLVGDFDPAEAITHGYVDSKQRLAWQTTNASLTSFHGFPSSIIEGTYRENDMTLNTSRRHVIATSGADKYLVSLAVTTALSQAVTDAPATDAIVNGFQVATPRTNARTPGSPAPHWASAPLRGQQPNRIPSPQTAPRPATVRSPVINVSPRQPQLSIVTPAPSQ